VRQEWSPEDVIGSWTLVGKDWRLVGNKSGTTRLGFAVLLKFFEIEGRFPRGADEVPAAAVAYLAGQVKVDAGLFADYPWSGRSVKYHREQIRSHFGFREFTFADEDKLAGWLADEVCPVELRDEQLGQALLIQCRSELIEPPSRIKRIIGSARSAFEKRFCDRTVSRLTAASVEALNGLIAQDAGPLASGRNLLAELKADPGKVSLETLLREIEKLAAVRSLNGCGQGKCKRGHELTLYSRFAEELAPHDGGLPRGEIEPIAGDQLHVAVVDKPAGRKQIG
jgi:hypothetical protein